MIDSSAIAVKMIFHKEFTVPPQQEYYRGVQDGMNGAKYDNPRNSPDYDRGYEEGAKHRQQN